MGAETLQIWSSIIVAKVVRVLVIIVVWVLVIWVLLVFVIWVLLVIVVILVVFVVVFVLFVVFVFLLVGIGIGVVVIVIVVVIVVIRGKWKRKTTLLMWQRKVVTCGNEPMAPSAMLAASAKIGKCPWFNSLTLLAMMVGARCGGGIASHLLARVS